VDELVVDAIDMDTGQRVTIRVQCENTESLVPHLMAHGLMPEGYHKAGQLDTDFQHPTLDQWCEQQGEPGGEP
jgi:hypothetical protein